MVATLAKVLPVPFKSRVVPLDEIDPLLLMLFVFISRGPQISTGFAPPFGIIDRVPVEVIPLLSLKVDEALIVPDPVALSIKLLFAPVAVNVLNDMFKNPTLRLLRVPRTVKLLDPVQLDRERLSTKLSPNNDFTWEAFNAIGVADEAVLLPMMLLAANAAIFARVIDPSVNDVEILVVPDPETSPESVIV